MRVPFHSSACGCPAIPVPYVEETILSPLNGLGQIDIFKKITPTGGVENGSKEG